MTWVEMSGNCVLDAYDANFYSSSPDKNPIAGASNIETVVANFIDIRTERTARVVVHGLHLDLRMPRLVDVMNLQIQTAISDSDVQEV